MVQVLGEGGLVPQGGGLEEAGAAVPVHVQKVRGEGEPELFKEGGPVHGLVHLVEEQEYRHVVALQEPPEGEGMALGAVGGGDHQDGAVEDLEGALGLGGEVHVAGGVEEGELEVREGEDGLLQEDGDAALALDGVVVQEGVGVIHAAEGAQGAAAVEEGFGEGGFTGVNVGEDAGGELAHGGALLSDGEIIYAVKGR